METPSTIPAVKTNRLRPILLIVGLVVLAVLIFVGSRLYRQVMDDATYHNPVVPVYSPDGALLAVSAGKDTDVYETAGYTPQLRLTGATGGVDYGMGFSNDNRLLQVNYGAWDAQNGANRYNLPGLEAFKVAYRSDNRQVAVFSFDGLYVFDAASGAQQARILTASGCACQTGLVYTAQGDLISAAMDGVKTWRVTDGEQLAGWKREGFTTALALSSDGRLAAFSEKDTVEIWDVSSGQKLRTLDAAPGAVSQLVFSADGSTLAGDANGADGVWVEAWSVETGALLVRFDLPVRVSGLALNANGHSLAAGAYDGKVRVYDLSNGVLAHVIDDFTNWSALVQSALAP